MKKECPDCKIYLREVVNLDDGCEDNCCYARLYQCDKCKNVLAL